MVPLLKRMFDELERLVQGHLALARLELGDDARALGRRMVATVVVLLVMLVGTALLLTSLSLFLGAALGLGWGFLIVGGLTVVGAGVGVLVAKQRQGQAEPILDDSREEAEKTVNALEHTKPEPEEKRHDLH